MYHRNPIIPPKSAAINTTISPIPGIYSILRYSEKIIFPEIHEKIASVKMIIAELPAARPSRPSVKFAPFDTDTIINVIMKT